MARQIFRQEALDRLASPDLLDRPVRIVRPVGWIGLGILLTTALVALIWAATTTAPVKVTGLGVVQQVAGTSSANEESDQELVGALFIPSPDSWRVQPGMTVEIDLSTVRREKRGYLLGTVAEISPSPVSREALRQSLKDDQLVDRLTRNGVPFQTTISLGIDGETTGDSRWSTARGAGINIHPGTHFDGQIIIGHRSLLSLLIPGLGQAAGTDDG